jgi:hypothetical protein
MKASEWGTSLETGLTDNFSSITLLLNQISHTVQKEEKSSHCIFKEIGTEKKKTEKIVAMECRDCIYII